MGSPSSSIDATTQYVTTGRVDMNLAMPDRDSFILIAEEAVGQLKRVFGSVGMGTIRRTINVHQESLSSEVLQIRAEPFVSAAKGYELHELFFGADGKFHELIIDTYHGNRTMNGLCYPVEYVGVVEPVRFFDLYVLGYHDRHLDLPATHFLDAVEEFLKTKEDKIEANLKVVSKSRQMIVEMQERLEKIRLEGLRKEHDAQRRRRTR